MDRGTSDKQLETPLLTSPADTMEHHDEVEEGNENEEEIEPRGSSDPLQEVPPRPVPTPTIMAAAEEEEAWYRNPHQLTAMLGNFSTSYNVVNISLVLPILEQLHHSSEEDAAACASSLLAGMILGQLLGGALGDSFLGRLGALRLVMAVQIVASIGSALLFGEKGDIYLKLTIWRFILGVGAGGVYPLAAVLSAEQGKNSNSHSGNQANQVHRVVLTFSTQGLGFVTVPIVAVSLLHITTNLDLIWRLILGFGSVPGIVLMLMQWRLYATEHARGQAVPLEDPLEVPSEDPLEDPLEEAVQVTENNSAAITEDVEEADGILRYGVEDAVGQRHGWWESLLQEPGLGRKVIGTAGTWFLFDVVFYGNTIFQPIVVEAAFGAAASEKPLHLLQKTAMDSLILASIALPGYAVAGMLIGKRTGCVTQTPRYVMLQGFAAMSILYLTIGLNWSYLRHYPAFLVFLYGMTFFFANYGPNTTTFILPSLLYSPECRSTWNGISAAAGKLGALFGATLFAPAADEWGDGCVMIICAGFAIFAFFLTYCFVPNQEESQPIPSTPSTSRPHNGTTA
jgi:PHS family inorganic phosphate transporter-like MFS transporter